MLVFIRVVGVQCTSGFDGLIVCVVDFLCLLCDYAAYFNLVWFV